MEQTFKSTKEYRIKLFSGADQLAELLILLAAKSNGGQWVSFSQMQSLVEAKKLEYPTLYKGYTGEVIGDKIFHLDVSAGGIFHLDVPAGGGEYKTVLAIEERELFEMEETMTEEEARNNAGYTQNT